MADPRPIPDLTQGEYDYPVRNAKAAVEIEQFANRLVLVATSIGAGGTLAGFLLPGAGSLAITATLASQVSSLKPMVRELICIYQTPCDELVEGRVVKAQSPDQPGGSLIGALPVPLGDG